MKCSNNTCFNFVFNIFTSTLVEKPCGYEPIKIFGLNCTFQCHNMGRVAPQGRYIAAGAAASRGG